MISTRKLKILLGAALLPLAAAAYAAPVPHPDPKLDPAAVVRIQLKAMAHNDRPRPDAGLAIVYGFASPVNREQTGPLEHFSAMVHTGYGQLLNHRSARLSHTIIDGDQALQGVELVDQHGVTVRFVFILSRQSEPPYAGCWMTDGVVPQPPDADQQAI
jgi:hypothetical protein